MNATITSAEPVKMKTRRQIERRAEFLADKFGLSLQLTAIWVEQHPEESRRPMLPEHVNELKKWARI